MAKYKPKNLYIYCEIYIKNKYLLKKEQKEIEEITEEANKLKKEYLNNAKKEFNNNTKKYINELFNPKKIFRLKKQKSYGFYKEYLENPIIKKYINDFQKIWINEKTIEELDEETIKFTNGKAKNFQDYYDDALNENAYRIINKIAIINIEKEIEKQEEIYKKQLSTIAATAERAYTR